MLLACVRQYGVFQRGKTAPTVLRLAPHGRPVLFRVSRTLLPGQQPSHRHFRRPRPLSRLARNQASKALYNRLIAEFLASGRAAKQPGAERIVVELSVRYLNLANGFYRNNGQCIGVVPGIESK